MISFKGYFSQSSTWTKFLVLAFLLLFSILLLSVSMLIEALLLKVPMSGISGIVDGNDASGIGFLRVVQVTQHLLLFLFPALMTVYLISKKFRAFLKLNLPKDKQKCALAVLVMLTAIPLVNYFAYLNMNFRFPSWMSGFEVWAREKEDFANKLVQMFFTDKRTGILLVNVFMMAVIPAISEEFLFRGLIQQLFEKAVKNVHIAVFVTAVLFSAMHMQFMGFLPRLFLGMVLGYIFVWTGSIWMASLAHFVNNFLGVITYTLFTAEANEKLENIGTPTGEFIYLIPASFVFGLLMYALYLKSRKDRVA